MSRINRIDDVFQCLASYALVIALKVGAELFVEEMVV